MEVLPARSGCNLLHPPDIGIAAERDGVNHDSFGGGVAGGENRFWTQVVNAVRHQDDRPNGKWPRFLARKYVNAVVEPCRNRGAAFDWLAAHPGHLATDLLIVADCQVGVDGRDLVDVTAGSHITRIAN